MMTTNTDAIGEEALKLLTESGIVLQGVALANMKAAKAQRKARLKEVLTIIWNGYEQGLTFNGQATKEEWANNFAKVSIRHIQHQVFGRKKSEANKRSRRSMTVKPGMVVKFGKRKFTVVSIGDRVAPFDWDDENGVHNLDPKIAADLDHDATVELCLKEIDPKPTHIKFSPRKALCQTRLVNHKIKGAVYASKDEDATCPDCVALRDDKLATATRSRRKRASLTASGVKSRKSNGNTCS
jgi:hypothetical protein